MVKSVDCWKCRKHTRNPYSKRLGREYAFAWVQVCYQCARAIDGLPVQKQRAPAPAVTQLRFLGYVEKVVELIFH